jgi:hypothetical protein
MTHFKRLLLVALGALVFFLSAWAVDSAATAVAAEPEKGLVAHWNFDEGEGTAAKDSAGKNDGKITGAKWVEGKVGKALDFDGTSAYVQVPDAPALNITQAITIEAWVKHRGTSFKTWEAVVAKGDSAYRIALDETDQSFTLGLNAGGAAGGGAAAGGGGARGGRGAGGGGRGGAGGGWWNLQSRVKPEADKWYFVVATYDGKQACIYVDGKLTNSNTSVPALLQTNTFPLDIGENSEQSGRNFTGVIDEVKIYNVALTADEIAKQFQAVSGTPAAPPKAAAEQPKPASEQPKSATEPPKTAAVEKEAGLIAFWSFDEGTGTAAKDSAGKHDGKIVNAKWVDGKIGKALDFNGSNTYVEIPNAPDLNLTKALSIEAWVKHRGKEITTWEAILAKGDTAYRLHMDQSDNSFGLGLTDGGFYNQPSTVVPEPDKWYFVVATYDGKKVCMYVDGKQTSSATDCPASISTNEFPVYIGENNEMTGRFFNGVIDEVKIYDRALSAEEVANQYQKVK